MVNAAPQVKTTGMVVYVMFFWRVELVNSIFFLPEYIFYLAHPVPFGDYQVMAGRYVFPPHAVTHNTKQGGIALLVFDGDAKASIISICIGTAKISVVSNAVFIGDAEHLSFLV